MRSRTPITLITGFLGSGKTTLLRELLTDPEMGETAVLVNELGEIALDHHLLSRIDERTVVMASGCVCCTIRADLADELRDLEARRARGEIPGYERVAIETTGLADPAPILSTLLTDPMVEAQYRIDGIVTTVDAVNAELHLSRNPEGVKQVAAADRIVVTKTDIADPDQTAAVRDELGRLNPSAELLDAAQLRDTSDGSLDPDNLLAPRRFESSHRPPAQPQVETKERAYVKALRRHSAEVASLSLALTEPLDWTAFGIWLSMLLNRDFKRLGDIAGGTVVVYRDPAERVGDVGVHDFPGP
jgi:G3E family GTPase